MVVIIPDMDNAPIQPANDDPFRIGVLLINGFALMSYAALVEPFRAANLMAGKTLYEVANIPAVGDAAIASSGALIPATGKVGQGRYDLIFVAAGGDPFAFEDRAVTGWLRRMARAGVSLGGVSGGPVILACAGLMAGRRMTVHWEHAARLTDMRPNLLVEQRLYVIDRDRLTCAGGAAPMDLTHALISQRHGPAFAAEVADWFHHTAVRPAADPQRAGLVARLGVSNRAVLDAVAAMESHTAEPLTLAQLAGFARLSPRQLTRQFHAAFGVTVMDYYRSIRLELAKRLLSTTVLSLTEIALTTGFATSSHFSRAFRDAFECSPSEIRANTRQKRPAGAKST
ncbi:MAG: GlxA family transcriptional regulator [Pikeienuella sp.]